MRTLPYLWTTTPLLRNCQTSMLCSRFKACLLLLRKLKSKSKKMISSKSSMLMMTRTKRTLSRLMTRFRWLVTKSIHWTPLKRWRRFGATVRSTSRHLWLTTRAAWTLSAVWGQLPKVVISSLGCNLSTTFCFWLGKTSIWLSHRSTLMWWNKLRLLIRRVLGGRLSSCTWLSSGWSRVKKRFKSGKNATRFWSKTLKSWTLALNCWWQLILILRRLTLSRSSPSWNANSLMLGPHSNTPTNSSFPSTLNTRTNICRWWRTSFDAQSSLSPWE